MVILRWMNGWKLVGGSKREREKSSMEHYPPFFFACLLLAHAPRATLRAGRCSRWNQQGLEGGVLEQSIVEPENAR